AHLPAAREQAHVAVHLLLREAEPRQHLARARLEAVAPELLEARLRLAVALDERLHLAGAIGIGERLLVLVERVRGLGHRPGAVERGLDDGAALHLAHVLREVADHHAAVDHDLAVVGLLLAREQAEERRLAGAVRADEADLLAALDGGRGFEEQDLPAVALGDAVDADHVGKLRGLLARRTGCNAATPVAPAARSTRSPRRRRLAGRTRSQRMRETGMRGRGGCGAIAAVLALAALAWATAMPARAAAPTPAARIEALIDAGELASLRWPQRAEDRALLAALYEPRGFAPLWLADGRPIAAAADAVRALREAGALALSPADYDADWLAGAHRALAEGERATADWQARFDVALSVAFLRFLSDLHGGRVNPRRLSFGFDLDPKRPDLATLLADAVREGRVAALVPALAPPFTQHRLLVEQLARYRALAADREVG